MRIYIYVYMCMCVVQTDKGLALIDIVRAVHVELIYEQINFSLHIRIHIYVYMCMCVVQTDKGLALIDIVRAVHAELIKFTMPPKVQTLKSQLYNHFA